MPWKEFDREVPARFKSEPGTVRVAEQENEAYRREPLRDFMQMNMELMNWLQGWIWPSMFPVAPRTWRAKHDCDELKPDRDPSGVLDSKELTQLLKKRSVELGISAIGIAEMDERYMYKEWDGTHCGDRVIVVAVEQDWEITQTIPSVEAERSAITAYAQAISLMADLGELLSAQGYEVQAHDAAGPGMTIHFGVEAGLGQLGLNGQLLTPQAGSRVRIMLMVTNAPLELDQPRDYGIPKLCDECQVCVRRCPPGAIPKNRKLKRGVQKAPINTKRCLPLVALAEGCAVCMKVCPVQRYGLEAVYEHWESYGEILGKGTEELEGYVWPLDHQFYGPGQKPRMPRTLTEPPGMPTLTLLSDPANSDIPDSSKN